MPVRSIKSTATYVEIDTGAGPQRFNFADFKGGHKKVATDLKAAIQDYFDVRILRTDLPDDEPTKTTDAVRPDLFWDGADLVGRGVVVTDVVWDGTTYGVSLRRAR